ncbi:Ubiquitin-like modifier-activating enzyme 6 [Echinococcus granulosus]|uniref:Ubiquitin modifier activating enzyme 6 n=1 Tax=Echinococcus granulosus TaxID=6210 RepID=A0A068WIJ1_ECHGR|nr:Ubiquitin-like modifier-activating enzyme 6 [Echinococcus granulosus]CDS19585.1 ubiquitin modifier activating enzyme 6 [Echinococcus granulosus]
MFPLFEEQGPQEIDDSFYSRQRYVIGDDAMRRLSDSCVLICGLGGVGVEIAKNLVLAGVRELILDDSTVCSAEDLASQFYVHPEDVAQGRTRAEASQKPLAALNPYVHVSIKTRTQANEGVDIDQEINTLPACKIHCMVITDSHLFLAALLNNYCRQHHIKFVYANTIGTFGNVFCDFGPNIKFSPPDEEPPSTFFIESIENAEKPKLVIRAFEQHKISDGGFITFNEVTGMVELNGKVVQVKEISPCVLELDIDTCNFGKFTGNGRATEVKQAPDVTHLPLAKQLEDPKLSIVDLVNPDSAAQMHVAFIALMAFIYTKKQLPKAWSKKDATLFLKLAERFCLRNMKIDTTLLERICFTSRGQLPPLCSFFGGVAAQEVIKAVTCRFTPLNQWMYFGADSVIPSEIPRNSGLSVEPRYRPLVRCIGPQNMRKVAMASTFMVGCGAIGCELLKNLALLGLASGAPQAAAAELSSNLSNSATSPSPDDETSAISSEIVEDDDNEELMPLIIRDFHHMVIELSHLGMELGVFRPYQLDHGDTFPVADGDLQSTPVASLEMPTMGTTHSPSATRGTMTALLTDASTGAVTALAGPQGESATELPEDENFAPLGSPATSSSTKLLRLPMITRVSSQSDYDADVESMAQQTFSCPQPTITTATVATNTDANTNANTCDGPCITITDMDHIEKSNLNRQFLFHSEHVGLAKSTVAAASIRQINPALKVVALQEKLDSNTEGGVFTDDFLQIAASGKDKSGPPIVLAALDNIKGRRYLDTRCVANRLAMFDSGTQGTKGHTQVILPGITESYSSQKDPPEEEGASDVVPYCTLKSFPAKASDCVEWAREKFFTQFTLKPQGMDRFLRAFGYSCKELRDALQTILAKGPSDWWPNDATPRNVFLRCLNMPQLTFFNSRPRTWKECICLGREKFEKYFTHKALHLLYKFPADKVLEGGEPFWQLPRRKPRPLTFDVSNKLHVDFVWSFARLLGKQAGIHIPSISVPAMAASFVKEALMDFTPKPYVPSDKEVIVDTSVSRPTPLDGPSSCPTADDEFHAQLEIAIARLSDPDCRLTCQSIEFDKDNEKDGHIDFIAAATNLRAAMYGLPETGRYEVKRIAGRIIPAIATTTAAVAGLVSLEVLKYICFSGTSSETECLTSHSRNNFVNLSLPSVISVLPGLYVAKNLPNNTHFTVWDRWEMKLPTKKSTLKEFIDLVELKYGLNVSLITQNCRPIYMTLLPNFECNLRKPMLSLLTYTPKDTYVDLVIVYEGKGDDDDDVEGPPFRLILPTD